MRECLEVWEDQKLDEEIARDARASGHDEQEDEQAGEKPADDEGEHRPVRQRRIAKS